MFDGRIVSKQADFKSAKSLYIIRPLKSAPNSRRLSSYLKKSMWT